MGGFGIPAGTFMAIYFLSSLAGPSIQRANTITTVGVVTIFLIVGLMLQGAYTEETIARANAIVLAFMAGSWTVSWLGKILKNDY